MAKFAKSTGSDGDQRAAGGNSSQDLTPVINRLITVVDKLSRQIETKKS